MVRPCFIVVDREYAASISTRKLVIETAKFNVLTAYSGREAVETLRKFPAVAGAVIDAAVRDMHCNDLAAQLKQIRPDMPVVAISAPGTAPCTEADHQLDSFDPASLLELLKSFVPEAAEKIEKQNEKLQKKSQ